MQYFNFIPRLADRFRHAKIGAPVPAGYQYSRILGIRVSAVLPESLRIASECKKSIPAYSFRCFLGSGFHISFQFFLLFYCSFFASLRFRRLEPLIKQLSRLRIPLISIDRYVRSPDLLVALRAADDPILSITPKETLIHGPLAEFFYELFFRIMRLFQKSLYHQ